MPGKGDLGTALHNPTRIFCKILILMLSNAQQCSAMLSNAQQNSAMLSNASNAQQIPKKAATLLQLLKSLIFGIKTEEEEGEY